jgi:membrane protease YdiL (CAAX protease family)
MSAELQSTLLKVGLPVLCIVIALVVMRLRHLSLREDLRLVWPPPRELALWLGLWIVWMAVSEGLTRVFGIPGPEPWQAYSSLIIALRILAIGILGPIAEEMIFRGVLFRRLSRTSLGDYGAIVILAAVWAAAHIQYGFGLIALIFLDGLVLGLARSRTRSLYLPMVMHILGNLFSIYQSLSS